MSGNLTIRQARLVLPDRVVTGDLLIEDGVISEIGPRIERSVGNEIDGTGLTALPGAIDVHVHFREPGLTRKESILTGSRAAAAGGVTSYLDLPNTVPHTTSTEALQDKLALAEARSAVHYGFYMGATADNIELLQETERVAGVAVHIGTSTVAGAEQGGLCVNDPDVLEALFASVDKPIAVVAEDFTRLRDRTLIYDAEPGPHTHALVHDIETTLLATRRVIELAQRYGRQVHFLAASSQEEVNLFASLGPGSGITAGVSMSHLTLDEEDIRRLGSRAVTNPPLRGSTHIDKLWQGLHDGKLQMVSSGHAPHTEEEKDRPWPATAPGIPGVEWTLPLLLHQVHHDRCTLRDVARWTAEAPARRFRIPRKGRLEVGFDGDVVLVDTEARRVPELPRIHTRAGWCPFAGQPLVGWPVATIVLGRPVYRDGEFIEGVKGRELTFAR